MCQKNIKKKAEYMKNITGMLVAVIGVACVVFGVMFVMQSNTSLETIANEIKPLQISQVDATYEQVKLALTVATDPAQVQTLTMQKTSLGLAKSNIGTVQFLKNSGFVNIVVGAGFLLTGVGLIRKD
jgi:cytochrome c biogenesis factor